MPKHLLFAIVLTVILVSSYSIYIVNAGSFEPGRKQELDTAVNQAKYIYGQRKEKGEDFSKGPCLSNALMDDWVLDIVHNPRQPVDDLIENKCSPLAKHIVELDTNGNLVRAK